VASAPDGPDDREREDFTADTGNTRLYACIYVY
jgi:hypothetical protein